MIGPVQSVQRRGTVEEKSGGQRRPGEPALLRTVPNPSLSGCAPHFYSRDPILLPEIWYYSPVPLSFPMLLAQTELDMINTHLSSHRYPAKQT